MFKLINKLGLLVLVIISIIFYFQFNVNQYLTLEAIQRHHLVLTNFYINEPIKFISLYFIIYVVSVAMSFPGATVLSLVGGYILGFEKGLIVVSFASTIGASIAFVIARIFFKEYLQKKFHHTFNKINRGMDREGNQYLLTLRLIPIFPFFLINILMGLTNISLSRYFIYSMIGMLPGTAVYVWAGTSLQEIHSLKDIFNTNLILIFLVIGIIPLVQAKLIIILKQWKNYSKFKKPLSYNYNLIVIGGGAAGLVNAFIASNLKAKVLLVEKNKMGGECLNYGCVPSKAFISFSKTGKYNASNFNELKIEIQNVIKSIEPHDSAERYTKMGVECMFGEAKLISPFELRLNNQVFSSKKIVIATGGKPKIPNIEGLNIDKVYHYENIWSLRNLPDHLVILGGGAIGCEMAHAFQNLGCKVTMIEKNLVLANEDRDCVEIILNNFKKLKIGIYEKSQVAKVNHETNTIVLETNGELVNVKFDEILVATGKVGNIDVLSSEMELDLDRNQNILVNDHLETLKYRNIYACGDVNGIMALTNAAAHQAWYTSVNALFGKIINFKIDNRFIPHAIFTEPELARVGLNESEAKQANLDFDVFQFDSKELDRSLIENKSAGKIKVLTTKGSDHILGVTIIGPHASEYISEYVLAMKYNLGLNKILNTSHIYPTFSEQNKFVAGIWKKKSINPLIFKILEKYHQLMK